MATAGDRSGPGPERVYHPALPDRGTITLSAEESGHLVRVRRVRAQAPVVCFDGRGTTRAGVLLTEHPSAAEVDIVGPAPDRLPHRQVTVASAVPKGAHADALVAGLAELGVVVWVPLAFDRTPARRMALVARRHRRWTRAATEACKVNGCATAMTIAAPMALENFVPPAPTWRLDPDPAAPPLGAAVKDVQTLGLVVGPEGGLTSGEHALLEARGVAACSVGACVLRVGTAAVVAAGVCLASPVRR